VDDLIVVVLYNIILTQEAIIRITFLC